MANTQLGLDPCPPHLALSPAPALAPAAALRAAAPFWLQASAALQRAFPEHYLFDPTPVPRALWRVARDCVAVEKLPGSQGAYLYTA